MQRRCPGCGSELPPRGKRGPERVWCSKRCANANAHLCVECSNPTSKTRCAACGKRYAADLMTQRFQARRERIADLYRQGASVRAIAAAVGSTENSIGVTIVRMRQTGWDLPYRHAPPKR